MDDTPVKRNSIFFNNLILLGLDCSGFEKKHGIHFHKDMFVLPNKKGSEVVTYFLFSKLSATTNKDYNLPWPLLSKELDRIFHKTCYSHLSSFAQENIVKFPRIVPSALSAFGGDRFYEVYLAFSSYVLSKTMRAKGYCFLSRPVVSRESLLTAREMLQLLTVMSMKRLSDAQIAMHANHLIWLRFTKNLSECLKKLKNILKTNKDLLKENLFIIGSSLSIDANESMKFQMIIEKIFKYYKPLQQITKKLDHFLSSETEFWQYLATDIGEQNESHILNGHSYNICETDGMPDGYLSEIHKTGFTTSEEKGKLSVFRFVKLLQAYLKYISAILLKANLSHLPKTCFVKDPLTHRDMLFYIDNLVKRISNEIPDLEHSIQNLKLISGYCELNQHASSSARHFFTSMPALNFDPEAVKGRVPHFNPGELFDFSIPDSKKMDEISAVGSLPDLEKDYPGKSSLTNLTCDSVTSVFNAEGYTEKASCTNSLLLDVGKKYLYFTELNSRKIEVPAENTPVAMPHINISDLDDLTFGPTSGFRFSESLLLEQSFNSVAQPDMSFD